MTMSSSDVLSFSTFISATTITLLISSNLKYLHRISKILNPNDSPPSKISSFSLGALARIEVRDIYSKLSIEKLTRDSQLHSFSISSSSSSFRIKEYWSLVTLERIVEVEYEHFNSFTLRVRDITLPLPTRDSCLQLTTSYFNFSLTKTLKSLSEIARWTKERALNGREIEIDPVMKGFY